MRELESLRNNLAHTQATVPEGWDLIVVACSRFEQNLDATAECQVAGKSTTLARDPKVQFRPCPRRPSL